MRAFSAWKLPSLRGISSSSRGKNGPGICIAILAGAAAVFPIVTPPELTPVSKPSPRGCAAACLQQSRIYEPGPLPTLLLAQGAPISHTGSWRCYCIHHGYAADAVPGMRDPFLLMAVEKDRGCEKSKLGHRRNLQFFTVPRARS